MEGEWIADYRWLPKILKSPMVFSLLSDAKSLGDCLARDQSVVGESHSVGAELYEKRLRELEVEKHELARKCQGRS